MPSKSKRKTSRRKPLVASNEMASPPPRKAILDYFSPSSPSDNNNDVRLEITSETIFYNGPTPDEAEELKNNIYNIDSFPTPDDSPVKDDLPIKAEPEVLLKVANPSSSDSSVSEGQGGSPGELQHPASSTSLSHSSYTSEENYPTSAKVKSKRRGRKPKVKADDPPKANHLLTDFFPVRKSSRKTAKELQREYEEVIRNKILDDCEEGLKIVVYEGKGRGIECARPFNKGEFIVEYAGDLVELKEAKYREEHYRKDISYGCYMYFFNHRGKSYCIDATGESGKLGRLLNHSRSKPNCVTKTIDIGDAPFLILVACRDIEAGEELVYDYGDRSKEAIESNPWLKE